MGKHVELPNWRTLFVPDPAALIACVDADGRADRTPAIGTESGRDEPNRLYAMQEVRRRPSTYWERPCEETQGCLICISQHTGAQRLPDAFRTVQRKEKGKGHPTEHRP